MTHHKIRVLPVLISIVALCLIVPTIASAQSGEGSYKLAQAIREQLVKDIELIDEADLLWLDLRRFYSQRRFRPVWFSDAGLNQRGHLLLKTIESAGNQGLDPEDYNLCFFQRHCNEALASQRLWVELLLTKSLMLYIEHMLAGRSSPQELGLDWHIAKPTVNTLTWLQNIVNADDFAQALDSLQPPYYGYHRLQAALLDYLQLQSAGGWPTIADGPTLRIWDFQEQVGVLRQRLQAEGDLLMGPVENALLFDEEVKLAVEHFQVRHGIDVDGVVGPLTRAAMNVPVTERIKQIEMNLERWRWLPRDLGERYLLVNIAGYELVVYEHNRPRKVLRIIAGTPERPTPALTGPLQAIVFNPYWHIPRTIALQDVIPRQRRNPGFFNALGIRVFKNQKAGWQEISPAQIHWDNIDQNHFPYHLRQDPGPKNSLGRIKIKFANDFALYLHDTPKQQLFQREERAFSSGCIRVENAIELAEYLLQKHNGWNRQKIQDVINSGETVSVALTEDIPLYLVYWTAWVSVDNHVYFRKDVYGWDRSQLQRQ